MFSIEEHLRDLQGHLSHVQDSGIVLGTRLIESGRKDFGRLLIARVHITMQASFTVLSGSSCMWVMRSILMISS